MTFAAPMFLLAGLAALIPVLLHLWRRQRAATVPFPTLRFLRVAAEQTRRRRRIQDLLLLLLRAGALALIALGLARPTITALGALWSSDSDGAVVIVLDRSASMGMRVARKDGGRVSRFSRAVDAVRAVLEALPERDRAAVLLSAGRPYGAAGRLTRNRAELLQLLDRCADDGPSYEAANLQTRLRDARGLLDNLPVGRRQIFLITDMQRAAWPASNANEVDGTGEPIPIVVIDTSGPPKEILPNAAVQRLEVASIAPVAGLPVSVGVELLGMADRQQRREVELRFAPDRADEPAATRELTLPPDGSAYTRFRAVPSVTGLLRGEVRLAGTDGSPMDDRRFFALRRAEQIRVAVVTGTLADAAAMNEAFYLLSALEPTGTEEWPIRVERIRADGLQQPSLDRFDVVFCVDLPAPDAVAAERLVRYVDDGGSVVFIAGPRVEPSAYNRMDRGVDGRLLPARLDAIQEPNDGATHIGFLDADHPALRPLVDPPSLYESVLVYRFIGLPGATGVSPVPDVTPEQLRTAAGGPRSETRGASPAAKYKSTNPRILARLATGEPLLLERRVGRGHVLWLGTSVGTAGRGRQPELWSNLALRPIFVPLVARLVFHLAGVESDAPELLAGTPLRWDLPGDEPHTIEVHRPNGETLRLKTAATEQPSHASEPRQLFTYADTHAVGVYEIRALDVPDVRPRAYAVNVDPAEARPERIDRAALEQYIGDMPLVFVDAPDQLAETIRLLREGHDLWTPLLATLLAVLVLETLLANRKSE